MDFQGLFAQFPPERVSWRVGSTNSDKTKGLALAYIDARDVMERLDSVFGVSGWQCRYSHAGSKTVCEIGVDVGDEWIWKANGAGDTDVEAEKGALSDAFKRCAVLWGIGRYLYDLPAPWVEIEQRGRSYYIKESEKPRLESLLKKNAGAPTAREATPRPPSHRLLEAMESANSHATKASLRNWWVGLKGTYHGALGDEYATLGEYVRARAATLPEDEQSEKDAA